MTLRLTDLAMPVMRRLDGFPPAQSTAVAIAGTNVAGDGDAAGAGDADAAGDGSGVGSAEATPADAPQPASISPAATAAAFQSHARGPPINSMKCIRIGQARIDSVAPI